MFQFTPARGGRRSPSPRPRRRAWGFNSRPRVAGDSPCRWNRRGSRCFNSRPRVAGDQSTLATLAATLFQFTPARGGRRHDLWPRSGSAIVSIHARAWRATPRRDDLPAGEHVSIHARAWRATSNSCGHASGQSFQFTPARGGRQLLVGAHDVVRGVSIHARAWRATARRGGPHDRRRVSIHARAWRATPARLVEPAVWARFNSRPRVAGDLADTIKPLIDAEFQFTPARGGRQLLPFSMIGCTRRFNSRPRVAGDILPVRPRRAIRGFNSRPRVAGDSSAGSFDFRLFEFQFTPARGGRHALQVARRLLLVSIHARAWRATRQQPHRSSQVPCFNSRPRVAGDFIGDEAGDASSFQFTPARGGRPLGLKH